MDAPSESRAEVQPLNRTKRIKKNQTLRNSSAAVVAAVVAAAAANCVSCSQLSDRNLAN